MCVCNMVIPHLFSVATCYSVSLLGLKTVFGLLKWWEKPYPFTRWGWWVPPAPRPSHTDDDNLAKCHLPSVLYILALRALGFLVLGR